MAEEQGELVTGGTPPDISLRVIGKVTHYFDRVGVAVIELSSALKVGDTIRILGGGTDFTQPVESMEVEHQKVQQGKAGDSVGLKVTEKVHDGYKVYIV